MKTVSNFCFLFLSAWVVSFEENIQKVIDSIKNAPENSNGLIILQIKDSMPKSVFVEQLHEFETTSVYIVYKVFQNSGDQRNSEYSGEKLHHEKHERENSENFSNNDEMTKKMKDTSHSKEEEEIYDIHYWVGLHSETEDVQLAARYAILLKNEIKRHNYMKEVENAESKQFRKYFPNGWNSESIDQQPLISGYLVKGNKEILVKPMFVNSFPSDDCVVIPQNGDNVFLYCGETANDSEEKMAEHLSKRIIEEQECKLSDPNGHSPLILAYNAEHASNEEINPEELQNFLAELGFTHLMLDQVSSPTMEDADFEKSVSDPNIIRIFQERENVNFENIKVKTLNKSILTSTDCFILDTDSIVGTFVWIGQQSTLDQQLFAAEYAEVILRNRLNGKPTAKITGIDEFAETVEFKINFDGWIVDESSTLEDETVPLNLDEV